MFGSGITPKRVLSMSMEALRRSSRMFSSFPWPARKESPLLLFLSCTPRKTNQDDLWELTDRQTRIEWFSQLKITASNILVVGCGGLGSNALLILIRMGFGSIDCCDPDLVEDSNRNRQLVTARDVGKPKAHAVLRNVAPFATCHTRLRGFHGSFQELLLSGCVMRYDCILCGVDNNPANVDVARYGVLTRTPVIFINVSRDGEAFRLFIQRPDEACFACYNPRALEPPKDIAISRDRALACTPDPSIGDVLMAAVAFGCRALTLEMCGDRISQNWNCRDITFYGLDLKEDIQRNPGCRVCARPNREHYV